MKDLMKYLRTTSKHITTLLPKQDKDCDIVDVVETEGLKEFVDIHKVNVYDNSKNYKGYGLYCNIGKIGVIVGLYKSYKETNNMVKKGWNYKDCVDIYFKPVKISGSIGTQVVLTQIPLFILDFSDKKIIVQKCKGYISEKKVKYIDFKTRSVKEVFNTVDLVFDKDDEKLIAENQVLSHQIDLYRNLFFDTANVVKNYGKIRSDGEKK